MEPKAYRFILDVRTFASHWIPLETWGNDELLLVAATLKSWAKDLEEEWKKRDQPQ